MSLRDIIFREIREEYNARGDRSFLYSWLRNGKLREKCEENPAKEAAIVHKTATDLMYNLGYPLAEKREKTEARSRTHNTALDLIDAWYSERGHTSSAFSESAADVSELQKLFIMLNEGRYTEALIPVKVDRITGGGLYIVGKALYPEHRFPYDDHYSCGLCIIAEWRRSADKSGVSLNYGDFGNEDLGACKNVKDALSFFENSLSENMVDYLNEMQNLNRYMPANCPESLKQYFADYDEDDDFGILTEENIREAKAEVEV
ncbi:MAG: hypothetical protein IK088_01960 [Lachnospiraceae bacterium]|nr:hypothetical protein [Lachnospiraceae bacterium]